MRIVWMSVLAGGLVGVGALAQEKPGGGAAPKPGTVYADKPDVRIIENPDSAPMPKPFIVRRPGFDGDWAPKKFDFDFAPKMASTWAQFAFQADRDMDRATAQANRQYERGRRSIDKREWDAAVANFIEVIATGKGSQDAAMYWKAFALGKLGRTSEAVASLDELVKVHPQSRWLNDARALKAEISQAAGRPLSPENAADDEMKLMALNGLLHSDPERSIPLLEKLLERRSSPQLQERALFVLSQSDNTRARDIVVKVAKGSSNPDLQMKALRSLGIYGGKDNRQILADVYASSNDLPVKQAILNSFMVSGERDRLLQIAKSDANVTLRKDAIHWLGTMGASSQLADLYAAESSPEVRGRIMHAIFVSGNSAKMIEFAKTEKDPKLRNQAIHHLGTMKSAETAAALVSLYGSSSELDSKRQVLHSLFVQGSAKQIVEIARKEPNVELKKQAVQHLSNMRSKEATDFLEELLK